MGGFNNPFDLFEQVVPRVLLLSCECHHSINLLIFLAIQAGKPP